MNSAQQDEQTNREPSLKYAREVFDNTPQVVDELRKIANKYMRNENAQHTLQATALVNEAYISLQNADVTINDKVHFFALAATHMRRILVDHAKSKSSQKRQAQAMAVSANDEVLENLGGNSEDPNTMILLDEVLSQFSALDDRASNMYEMRLFAGLSNGEIAQVFEVSITTVERDIAVAKAWIHKKLHDSK